MFLCIFLMIRIVDISQHAFLIGFYKAIPVWMCSILAMVGQDSVVGVALVFGSSGDIILDIRDDETFKSDKQIYSHLFKLGGGLFLVQHCLIIFQFISYWNSFKTWSLFSYFIVFNVMYFLILPNIPNELTNIAYIYSFILTTSCFLSINGLSPHKTLKHERFNVYATMLFLFSDTLVILKEIDFEKNNDTLIAKIKSMNPILMKNIIMITYYLSQILFANGAYNRYRYKRSLSKRK